MAEQQNLYGAAAALQASARSYNLTREKVISSWNASVEYGAGRKDLDYHSS
jgi:hypothetical protein